MKKTFGCVESLCDVHPVYQDAMYGTRWSPYLSSWSHCPQASPPSAPPSHLVWRAAGVGGVDGDGTTTHQHHTAGVKPIPHRPTMFHTQLHS